MAQLTEAELVTKHRKFRDAIGHALSVFSEAEHLIGRLFCLAVGARDGSAAYKAFWTVISFNGRLQLASAAVEHELHANPTGLQRWKDLRKDLSAHAAKRNQLAHGTIVNFHDAETGTDVIFCPYMFKDTITAIAKNLSLDEVQQAPKEFSGAREAVSDFYQFLLVTMAKEGHAQLGPSEQHLLDSTPGQEKK